MARVFLANHIHPPLSLHKLHRLDQTSLQTKPYLATITQKLDRRSNFHGTKKNCLEQLKVPRWNGVEGKKVRGTGENRRGNGAQLRLNRQAHKEALREKVGKGGSKCKSEMCLETRRNGSNPCETRITLQLVESCCIVWTTE